MIKISNPQPLFLDARGALSDGGYIYIGQANADPETTPINVYWDAALTILAKQPLRTIGGLIVNGATPANVFCEAADYSMRLLDSDRSQVFYAPSVFTDTTSFQPASSDLTAIAALATTPFGRNLLALTGQSGLQAAVGYPAPLPASGGTVSGGIIRRLQGLYVHWEDPAYIGDTFYVRESGATDPTYNAGDVWITLA